MKVEIQDKKILQIKADYEVIFVIGKNLKHKWLKNEKELKELKFKGGEGESALLVHRKKLYIGVDSLNHEDIRIAVAQAIKNLQKVECKSFKIASYLENEKLDNIQAMTEGARLGDYDFDLYKSEKNKKSLKKMIISTEEYSNLKFDFKVAKELVKDGSIISEATNFTRDIVNQIPAEITPVKMTEIAKHIAEEHNLKVVVRGEKYLEKNEMGAFLAVSKASPFPPQLIHLTYKPENAKKKICIVGKGLTYDSGGLSLKPSDAMLTMKSDKSGASAVLGIMKAVSALKLPYEVHGIVGAVENMVGQHAFKPDDVLKAMNGKTIEVKNTDAEGRLVLADCLVYAQNENPDYIIDIATLTGACMVALGEYTTGVIGFDKDIKGSILEAGEKTGELVADLPFNKYLAKLMKSDIADVSNISSSKFGGAITAGVFLGEFIEEKNRDKWVHLDIAGPSYVQKDWAYNSYGASGAGVRLLVNWIKNI